MAPHRLVLASTSASRLKVLRDAGLRPEVVASGVSEETDEPDTANRVVILAERKAQAVATGVSDALVVGCDSLLDLNGRARGKPNAPEEATQLWRELSGKSVSLFTGQCVVDTRSGRSVSGVATATIRYGTPTSEEIEAYVATGEPLLSAGGFTIEGYGAPFIDGIEGDPTCVLGISLPLLRRLMAELGVAITDLWP